VPEPIDLEERKPFDKLKTLLIGREKSGKSWLSATSEKPVLIHDFDLRADSLSGRPGVFALQYKDPAPHMQPTAFPEFLDVLTKLEQGADLRDLGFARVDKGVRAKTHVPDSITTLARAACKSALYSNTDIRRRLTFGGVWQVDFVKNFDGWNAEMSTVESVILRAMSLKAHLICTIHEAEEQTEDSKPDAKKFTGKIGVFPARYDLLLKYFNDVWHIEQAPSVETPSLQSYTPRVQVKPDYRAPWAVTTLDIPTMYVKPDIQWMILEHLKKHPTPQPSVPQLAKAN
jgi:AAA domain